MIRVCLWRLGCSLAVSTYSEDFSKELSWFVLSSKRNIVVPRWCKVGHQRQRKTISKHEKNRKLISDNQNLKIISRFWDISPRSWHFCFILLLWSLLSQKRLIIFKKVIMRLVLREYYFVFGAISVLIIMKNPRFCVSSKCKMDVHFVSRSLCVLCWVSYITDHSLLNSVNFAAKIKNWFWFTRCSPGYLTAGPSSTVLQRIHSREFFWKITFKSQRNSLFVWGHPSIHSHTGCPKKTQP